MNTPSHVIFGLTAFARGQRGAAPSRGVTAAVIAGAMIPDLSLYLMAGTHLFILGTPPRVVFGEMYFSDSWQAVFRIDNSFILWGIALAMALAAGRRWAVALTAAALLHLSLDFPLHHNDGRAHFWPMTTWVFESPVSYWDRRQYASFVAPVEIGLSLVFCLVLWRRFTGRAMRLLIGVLALTEAAPGIVFGIVFAAGQ